MVGFVTRGRGIAIHQRRCRNIVETREPERLVEVDWGPGGDGVAVDIEIEATDRSGLMGDLSRLITSLGVNILSARGEARRARGAWLRFTMDCRSADQVARVIGRIGQHPDVIEVRRIGKR